MCAHDCLKCLSSWGPRPAVSAARLNVLAPTCQIVAQGTLSCHRACRASLCCAAIPLLYLTLCCLRRCGFSMHSCVCTGKEVHHSMKQLIEGEDSKHVMLAKNGVNRGSGATGCAKNG
eukprot:scaffold112807_cov18-Tisochrysis_lutea.AAC.1